MLPHAYKEIDMGAYISGIWISIFILLISNSSTTLTILF